MFSWNMVSGVWDSLLEVRIRLQQVLIHANKLPQTEQFHKIVGSSATGGLPQATSVKLAVSDLLDDLIELKVIHISQ